MKHKYSRNAGSHKVFLYFKPPYSKNELPVSILLWHYSIQDL